jgi:hypothetical protein
MSSHIRPPTRPADPVVIARERGQALAPEQEQQDPHHHHGRTHQPRGPPKVSEPVTEPITSAGLLWGGRQIAAFADLELKDFYSKHRAGVFDGVVFKVAHKTLVASKADVAALPRLATRAQKPPALPITRPAAQHSSNQSNEGITAVVRQPGAADRTAQGLTHAPPGPPARLGRRRRPWGERKKMRIESGYA